jgi:hypothetical protein
MDHETLRQRWAGGDREREKAILLAKAAKLAKEIQSQMLRCGARFQPGTDVAEELKVLNFLCDLGALCERLAFSSRVTAMRGGRDSAEVWGAGWIPALVRKPSPCPNRDPRLFHAGNQKQMRENAARHFGERVRPADEVS